MLLRNGSNRRDDYRACFKQFKQPKPRTRPLNTVSLKFVKRLDFPRILCSGGLDAFLWLKRVHFIFRYKSRTKLPLTVYFGSLPHTFDKFESWHQSVRQTQLKAKYDGPAKQIFRDLKKTVKNTPDSFLTASSFEILAVDPESDQVHLEEVVCPHASSYELDGQKICPANFDGVVLTLPPGTNAEVGSVLTQQVFSREIADLHQTLMDFWRPRWQKQSSIPPEQWVRVVSFTRAYMPSLQLHLAPLTLADWRAAVSHMKPTAARGPDGFARDDLLYMSDHHLDQLLRLLHDVEQGHTPWPRQLLLGFVICIAKRDDAHTAADYRPINLFSVINRVWSSLRTRQMLTLLAPYLDHGVYGFVPGCEAAQVWAFLQASSKTTLIWLGSVLTSRRPSTTSAVLSFNFGQSILVSQRNCVLHGSASLATLREGLTLEDVSANRCFRPRDCLKVVPFPSSACCF